ncbi:hypothetical protein I6F11_04175 [Ensifer sp. NBAIM29]|nr:hypothetical protein [Ensifer sp. NBAIM29]
MQPILSDDLDIAAQHAVEQSGSSRPGAPLTFVKGKGCPRQQRAGQ